MLSGKATREQAALQGEWHGTLAREPIGVGRDPFEEDDLSLAEELVGRAALSTDIHFDRHSLIRQRHDTGGRDRDDTSPAVLEASRAAPGLQCDRLGSRKLLTPGSDGAAVVSATARWAGLLVPGVVGGSGGGP
jgi:hypothetical protein